MPALIVGARPRAVSSGPIVRLEAGVWRIVTRGHKDSHLMLRVIDPLNHSYPVLPDTPSELDLPEAVSVQLLVKQAGSEEHISAFAEKIK